MNRYDEINKKEQNKCLFEVKQKRLLNQLEMNRLANECKKRLKNLEKCIWQNLFTKYVKF